MTTWGQVSVGDVVIHSADDYDGEYVVKAVKSQGKRVRVVLSPKTGRLAAKVAVIVPRDVEVDLPEGAEPLDPVKKLVEEDLGGQLVATVKDDVMTCPKMDTTLIAAHLKLIHGVELRGLPLQSEDELLKIHEELHAAPFHEPTYRHVHEG